MSTAADFNAKISLDLKKNRIRVYKSTLHKLGNPSFIQLLVNPRDRVVAIRCIDKPLSGEPVHKISEQRMVSDNSYEIYSQSFLRKLFEIVPELESSGLYRMDGKTIPQHKVAIFYLKTLCRYE